MAGQDPAAPDLGAGTAATGQRIAARRLSTAARARRAAAASAWCCWSRWLLVGAAAGLLYIGRANAGTLYSGAAGRARHRRRVRAVRAGRRHPAACRPRARATRCSRRWSTTPSTASWSPTSGPRVLRQRHLSRPDRRGRRQRRAPDRAGLRRRSRRLRGDLPPAQGRARGPPACRRRCASPAPTAEAGALAAPARAPARRQQARRAHDGLVDRRRDARPRAPGKRVPGTAARHRLSRPRAGRLLLGRCRRATSSISTPRSPTGSTTISPRSAPARSSSPTSSPARARRCSTTLTAAPGEVKTEVLDLDLKTRGGKPVPVRLFHKVAFGADGAAGASRTLVLNRARDDGTDPQRAAEVRFMRFFQNTPMAIATVDKTGRIARSNARFASAFEGMLKGDERSILSVVAERDRAGAGSRDPQGGARARATSRRSRPRSPAPASAGRASSSRRSRRRSATARRRSSTRSRPPRSARWRTASTSSRRWSRSASSPAASRTTSTTCSPPS